ncbi:unnamed protein product [Schistosoma mattheei]|uniref:Uncharacterized protein n=1 Tax=Schistosoma mattheei TaxID=31246 RepID=A0A183PU75_9TREM|nr:unnamed protein product [Schistosoma mattheei]
MLYTNILFHFVSVLSTGYFTIYSNLFFFPFLAVMQALCTLGKTTSVLQEPNKLPEQSRSLSITNLF